MQLDIRFGLKDEERLQVARILYESLGRKIQPVFGPIDKGLPIVAEIFQEDRMFVAISDGIVLGFSGLQFLGKSYLDPSFRFLVRRYGLGVFRVIFNGWLLEADAEEDELYLDTLAVAENWRGKGIGTLLIDEVLSIARKEKFRCVKLSVVDTNPRAKAFYERVGFQVKKTDNIPFPWNRIFKISSATVMEYTL